MVPTIDDLDFKDKRVLVRTGYDLPLDDNGNIVDDMRIQASIPTLKKLFEKGAKQLIIMFHMGRPKGVVEKLKTDKVAIRLMKLLGKTVQKVNDCIDVELPDVPVAVLENLRFHKEEQENDPVFAKKLAEHADVYVNEAFSVCHRDHASMTGVPKYLSGCVGLHVESELAHLQLENPQRPFVIVLGGAKLETKLDLIQTLLKKADKILLGGAMVFTFYKAQGLEIGKSLLDKAHISMAKMLVNNEKIILPEDIVVAENPEGKAETVPYNAIPQNMMGLDIGEKTIEQFKNELAKAKTVVWNGPLGYFEKKPFDKATDEIVRFISELDATTIIGGGDSAEAVHGLGLADKFTHVSTGGGASMKLLEGKELVAIKALR